MGVSADALVFLVAVLAILFLVVVVTKPWK